MTSCLNHDYLILIFIDFPYLLMKILRLLLSLQRQNIFRHVINKNMQPLTTHVCDICIKVVSIKLAD
jgi:hypothetical protein